MKKSTIHNALDLLDESYISEGIELFEKSLSPQHKKKKHFTRILWVSALFVLVCVLSLFPVFLSDKSPNSTDEARFPPSSSHSEENTDLSESPKPTHYDPYTLIDFEILPYYGSFYLYFPESAQNTLQIGSSGTGPVITDPTILPEFDDRTMFFPFESVENMVEMFTADSQMPLWFAEYILEHFPKSGDMILLPDFENIVVPTLPQSFQLGKAYLSGEYYCVQVLSDHFTNGLFNSFATQEEYADHYDRFSKDWSDDEKIRILKTYDEQTDGLLLCITDYLQNGFKYKRVETTLTDGFKKVHVVATYPFPRLGSTQPISDTVLPQDITLYIEDDGLYGSIYLTQLGKNISYEELFAFGIEKHTN